MSRPDVTQRNIQSGKLDWYAYDKKTGATLAGPYATKDQAKGETFDLAKGTFTIERERALPSGRLTLSQPDLQNLPDPRRKQ